MIVFNGHLSGTGFKHYRKTQWLLVVKCVLVMLALSVLAYFFVPDDNVLKKMYTLSPITVGIPISFGIIVLLNVVIPNHIEISMDRIVRDSVDGRRYTGKISKIKRVEKYKEYYYIQGAYFYQHLSCVCQKDLLVEGSLEEFEELFADRIVSKE